MNRQLLVTIGLLAVIALSLFSALRLMVSGPPNPSLAEDQSWFWDLEQGRAFHAPSLSNPPVESPWGNPSPMVLFFTCTDCEERFPGIFISFSPETKARLDADPNGGGAALGPSHPGRLYSADGTNWVEAASMDEANEKARLSAKLARRCPGRLSMCR